MLRTFEATIDEHGRVIPGEPIKVLRMTPALVTIFDDDASDGLHEVMILAESALADGWVGPEADAAWAHLADLPDLGLDDDDEDDVVKDDRK